jgi:hypothetical protein
VAEEHEVVRDIGQEVVHEVEEVAMEPNGENWNITM